MNIKKISCGFLENWQTSCDLKALGKVLFFEKAINERENFLKY